MKRRFLPAPANGNATAAALSAAAALMLVPANLLPVLSTETTGENRDDTIFSGAMQLWHHNLAPIAIIVFVASMVIPVAKLVGLTWLMLATRGGPARRPLVLTRIYNLLDGIGRWSLLDVFLAAFLTGLIEFGEFATVRARAGIVAFAAAVILTVLATEAFDPRTIWNSQPDNRPTPTPP